MKKPAQTSSDADGFDPKPFVRPGLGQKQIINIKATFDIFDKKKSGFIDAKDLKIALQRLGQRATSNTIFQYINDLDAEGTGAVDFKEFVYLMSTRITDADPRSEISKLFALFDDDKTGYITIQGLRRVMKEVGENYSEDQIQEIMDRGDLDGDGVLNQEEFYNLITHKTHV